MFVSSHVIMARLTTNLMLKHYDSCSSQVLNKNLEQQAHKQSSLFFLYVNVLASIRRDLFALVKVTVRKMLPPILLTVQTRTEKGSNNEANPARESVSLVRPLALILSDFLAGGTKTGLMTP